MSHRWKAIWCVDFEFGAPEGGRPDPLCVVARDLVSGRLIRVWLDPNNPVPCPLGTGPDELFVSFYASAEIGCMIVLGWPIPARILDLCAEFRWLTCGLAMPHGRNLIGALEYFGLPSMDASEKEELQMLAAGGRQGIAPEQVPALLDYCQSDVDALARLYPVMEPRIDLPRALIRGRFMAAAAQVEHNGVPIDVPTLETIKTNWPIIRPELISAVDQEFGVYDGETFSKAKFDKHLAARGIWWPRTTTGLLELKDKTFDAKAKLHPELQPLRQLRSTLESFKMFKIAVGPDGRNRTMLSAFKSITGRNQPSNTKNIFGPSTWVRHLIKPEAGRAVAYLDWSSQEFAVGAALSRDPRMLEAYRSGDPYIYFARMAGAVPAGATKQTHPAEREKFKTALLAVLYGKGPKSLAQDLKLPTIYGRDLLKEHRQTFPRFWSWVDDAKTTAAARGRTNSVFGWQYFVTSNHKPTTFPNWWCQATGADMMRLAVIAAVERGIRVCMPVHDALLIEAPEEEIESVVAETKAIMVHASRIVLHGEPVRVDAKIVRYPDRYVEPRGAVLWREICRLALTPAGRPTSPA